ncbi:hypothetical protein RJ641_033792 [Dillenia turbinata]|uniref:Uncharacterized protein n=1 Tax=Dillenia turbinata TaxID=194707 RepID=A0AAN8W0B4_9MAGN
MVRHGRSGEERMGRCCNRSQTLLDITYHCQILMDDGSLLTFQCPALTSWNLAASDNHLWQMQYASFFGHQNSSTKINGQKGILLEEVEVGTTNTNWRERPRTPLGTFIIQLLDFFSSFSLLAPFLSGFQAALGDSEDAAMPLCGSII